MNDLLEDRLKAEGDRFYAALMAAHRGRSFEESARLNARLVLLMANAIADGETLRALLEKAAEASSDSPRGELPAER